MSLRTLILAVFFLICQGLLLFIGSYQLFVRAPYKAALIAEQEQSAQQIIGALDLALNEPELDYRQGFFILENPQFFAQYALPLGSRSLMGVDGHHLLGLLDLGAQGALLVDRGWVSKSWLLENKAASNPNEPLKLRLFAMPSAQEAAEDARYNDPERQIWNRLVPQQIFAHWGVEGEQLPFYAQVVSDQELAFGSPFGALPLAHPSKIEIKNNHVGYAMT